MNTAARLSDFDHPAIANLAAVLTSGMDNPLDRVSSIFKFVRDKIEFGFNQKWDNLKASEIVVSGMGQCNNKAILFVALCKAAGIPARVHFALIDMHIMHGVIPAFAFPLLPQYGGHSWTEVYLDGKWKSIDSYINDKAFYDRALKQLKESGLNLGYSIAFSDGKSSSEFNFGEIGFSQMGAVRVDQGVWDDSADYFATEKYIRFTRLQAMGYPMVARIANRNIRRIRQRQA